MPRYEVTYTVKHRGREYPALHTVEAETAEDAIKKTREWTRDMKLPHPFRPKAKKILTENT